VDDEGDLAVRVKIEQTRTFATRADGGALNRTDAQQCDPGPPRSFRAELPRTPPPRMSQGSVDDIGDLWLAATGVPNVLAPANAPALPADVQKYLELARSWDALGEAWVAHTTAGVCVMDSDDGLVPRHRHRTPEQRLWDAERRNAVAQAELDRAQAELATTKSAKREAEQREREGQREIAQFAHRIIRGEEVSIPARIEAAVAKAVPRVRAAEERRRRDDRASLLGIGYQLLDQRSST
jgi:hypothetical protein